jgi:predicted dehydrogenase
MSQPRTIRLIQVGLGSMGSAWLRTVKASPQAEFAAFVEVDGARAASQAQAHSLDPRLVFSTLDEALAAARGAGPVDGVLNITPPQAHRDVSCAALEAGLPVLSEKPLADTLDAARDIVRAAERTGVLHVVAQNYRYRPPIQALSPSSILASSAPSARLASSSSAGRTSAASAKRCPTR